MEPLSVNADKSFFLKTRSLLLHVLIPQRQLQNAKTILPVIFSPGSVQQRTKLDGKVFFTELFDRRKKFFQYVGIVGLKNNASYEHEFDIMVIANFLPVKKGFNF